MKIFWFIAFIVNVCTNSGMVAIRAYFNIRMVALLSFGGMPSGALSGLYRNEDFCVLNAKVWYVRNSYEPHS